MQPAPLICVYFNPEDYPGKYVGRLWFADKPTNTAMVTDTLEELRTHKPGYMMILPRQPEDDPVVVEVWV